MGSATPPPNWSHLPAVDERLVMPETRYEIEDGRVLYVAPADELHASRHSKLSAILEAHTHPDFDVAVDMLTRTSATDDFAPDASVFPRERDPNTGMRQIEQLAFEIVSTERLGHTADKAKKLVERGVRRVFAIDVERRRALEWSTGLETWQMLATDGKIADQAFVVPLPIEALVSVSSADDAVAAALIAKGNPVIENTVTNSRAEGEARGRAEGQALSVLAVLQARALETSDALRRQILECRDVEKLGKLLEAAVAARSTDDLLLILR
ncbi:MAG TPA: Uma2 family endonuclease [Polyangiaceae bacterium]